MNVEFKPAEINPLMDTKEWLGSIISILMQHQKNLKM